MVVTDHGLMDNQGRSYWEYAWCGRSKNGYFVCNMILLGLWPFMDESISNRCSPSSADMSYVWNTICCCSCCRCYCKQCLMLAGICPNIAQRAWKLRINAHPGTHIRAGFLQPFRTESSRAVQSPVSWVSISISRNPTFPRDVFEDP